MASELFKSLKLKERAEMGPIMTFFLKEIFKYLLQPQKDFSYFKKIQSVGDDILESDNKASR